MAQQDDSIFSNLSKALRSGRRTTLSEPEQGEKSLLTTTPSVTDNNLSKQDKQQKFLDLQSQKLAYDIYARSAYYGTDRLTAYQDYRAMDSSPEISAALDILADEICTRGENGKILSIYSENSRIKSILNNLFERNLNINLNLSYWSREFLKYGDFFLALEIDQKDGIYDVRGMRPEDVSREEAWDGNASSSRFKIDSSNMYMVDYQMAHFRVLSDSTMLPYGKSILFPIRKLWKQLQLAEDAMLTYRITRAPERRVFYIEVGNIDPADIPQYIEKVKATIKKAPTVNQHNGAVNLKYSPMSLEEDFFLPQRNEKSSRIETLPGACIALDTKINLLDGRQLELSKIIYEFERGIELSTHSVNPNTGEVLIGKISNAIITRLNTEVVKVILENGKEIVCTPDHKFHNNNGVLIEAKNLKNELLWKVGGNLEDKFLKVIDVIFLEEKIDTGTLTIDENEEIHNFHNFALTAGVYTKNSNLDQIADIEYLQNKLFAALKVPKPYLNYAESIPGGSALAQSDLRFARTVTRLQNYIVVELRRIANIHLFLLGFEDYLDDFEITLTNPSTQQELLKLETQKARLDVFKEMFTPEGFSPLSWTKAMQDIMGYSESDIKLILKQKKMEKKMFAEIEGAASEYKETGMFTDIDKKFRRPDFDPNQSTGAEGGGEGGAGADLGGGGGGDFGAGSSFGGADLGGGGLGEPGLETPEAGTETPEAGAETPEAGTEESPITENNLLGRNDLMMRKTKNLLESLEKNFNKIEIKKKNQEDSDDENKQIID